MNAAVSCARDRGAAGTVLRLVRVLARSPGRVFTRGELVRAVYGHQPTSLTARSRGDTRTLAADAEAARRLLRPDGWRLEDVWGVGYRLMPPAAGALPSDSTVVT